MTHRAHARLLAMADAVVRDIALEFSPRLAPEAVDSVRAQVLAALVAAFRLGQIHYTAAPEPPEPDISADDTAPGFTGRYVRDQRQE